ncbi:hypothetical protein Tsubulata_031437 [Turnera subulata]|uniref:DUF4283 domain-containing protein n=1 Tax=Turnera subulata TaxID=218843 RepID=A0A9Q0G6S5_9ROSI|nr:hypothetical protein Tsubulata_031437 [Turnera subulata]
MLCNRLQRLWGLRGSFNVMDLDHYYFLVRLSNSSEYLSALTGGPWVILDHYLTVEPWKPNFEPTSHKVTSVVAWIRVPGLSSELYQLAILREICNRIGKLIRVDYSAQKTERGRFAKAVVDLDLSTPLQTKTCVDGVWYTIMYKNLPQMCFECGREGPVMAVSNGGVSCGPFSKYGQWILVPPKVRNRNRKSAQTQENNRKDGQKNLSTGSRFGALASTVDEPVVEVVEAPKLAAPVGITVISSGSGHGTLPMKSGSLAEGGNGGVKSGKQPTKSQGIFINEPAAAGAPVMKRAQDQAGYSLSGVDLAKAAVAALRKSIKSKKGKDKVGEGVLQVDKWSGVLAGSVLVSVSFKVGVQQQREVDVSAPNPPSASLGSEQPGSLPMAVVFDPRGQSHNDAAVPRADPSASEAHLVQGIYVAGNPTVQDMTEELMQTDS